MASGPYNVAKFKPVEYEVYDDTQHVPSSEMKIMNKEPEKPREFKAKMEVQPDGTRRLVVQTQSETIVRPDGSKDVIIHAPSLDMMNKFNEENNK